MVDRTSGGLGVLLFEGLRVMHLPKILWGCVLSAGLAIAVNTGLKAVEKHL